MEERWRNPNQCDLCGEITKDPEEWNGWPLNFTFCQKCDKIKREECSRFASDKVREYFERTREYYAQQDRSKIEANGSGIPL